MHNNDIQKKHPYYLQRTLTSGFRACARGEFSHPDLCLQGEFCLVSKQSKNGFKLSILILDEIFIQIPGPPWRVHRQSEVVTHIFFAFLGKTFWLMQQFLSSEKYLHFFKSSSIAVENGCYAGIWIQVKFTGLSLDWIVTGSLQALLIFKFMHLCSLRSCASRVLTFPVPGVSVSLPKVRNHCLFVRLPELTAERNFQTLELCETTR